VEFEGSVQQCSQVRKHGELSFILQSVYGVSHSTLVDGPRTVQAYVVITATTPSAEMGYCVLRSERKTAPRAVRWHDAVGCTTTLRADGTGDLASIEESLADHTTGWEDYVKKPLDVADLRPHGGSCHSRWGVAGGVMICSVQTVNVPH
jgi:hypothetical protein